MKQLYYTLQYLFRGRNSNLIKIISLTFGFTVGLILFARVAFELSFDTFFDRADELYMINNHYEIKGEDYGESPIIFAPVAGAMLDEFPEVTYATAGRIFYGNFPLYYENDKFNPRVMMADSLFFKTMGIEVLRGEDRMLGWPDHLFLSEDYARRIFGTEDPVGKRLLYRKNYPYTVAGIFKNIPENSHLRFDMVASFINMKTQFGHACSWERDDSYTGYVRMKPGTDIAGVERRIPGMLAKYVDVEKYRREGIRSEYSFKPVAEVYTKSSQVTLMIFIMSVLGFSLLFVAAMNYVLISVSSLPLRARSIAVHKCNGATGAHIFGQFMLETGVLFVCALGCVALLLLAFRGEIAEMAAVRKLGSLLNGQTLWLPALMLGLIFLVASVLPARLLSDVPVTQIFRITNVGKRWWKQTLLFAQFGGIALVITLLVVVLLQYRYLMNRDLGFASENVVYAELQGVKDKQAFDMLNAEFRRLPYVETTGMAGENMVSGYGGLPIEDAEGNVLFTARATFYDPGYVPLMKIALKAGRNVEREGEVLINETFRRMHAWDDNPLEKEVVSDGQVVGKVVGVTEDFRITSLYASQTPVLIRGTDAMWSGCYTLRLTGVNSERLSELNEKLARLYPNEDLSFRLLTDTIEAQYEGARHFRDGVTLAAIVILSIALMGLFGYVNDEIHRRSKEIAIRKVNGATASDILRLISKDVLVTALPSLLLGVIIARYVSEKWLQQFAEKVPLSISVFLGSICGLLLLIWICLVLRAWKTANENPVNSIKTE